MANWIANKITAKGIKNLDIFDENGLIDFNKIIPEPADINNCPDEFRYDLHPDAIVMPNKEKPWFNWYTWRNKFWGVNVNSDTHCADEKQENDTIWFDTKWNCPKPVIETVSKMLGDTELELIWEDLESGFTPVYKLIYKNGTIIKAYEAYYDFENNVNNSVLGDWSELKVQ